MLNYYLSEVQPLWPVFMDMRQRGIRVSAERLDAVRTKLLAEQHMLEAQLQSRLGWLPNTKSWKDMGRLFEELGVTPMRTPTGRPKHDDDAIRAYADRWVAARDVLDLTLAITEKRTFVSGFLGMRPDPSWFYHPAYNLDKARTGRASSEGDDEGGPQLQNIPESLRHIFVPDKPDDVFVQFDLEQAESKIVAYDAQDLVLIDAFERRKDIHAYRGCLIYKDWNEPRLPPDEVLATIRKVCDVCALAGEKKCSHSERHIAKVNGHAYSYKMGPRKQCTILRAGGIYMSEAEAKRIRDKVVSRAIREWQDYVYVELRRSRWLTNLTGRKREFFGLLDEDMVRAALSWKAQSVVRDVISRAMLRLYPALPTHSRIVTQTHDSLLLNTPQDKVHTLLPLIHEATNTPITCHGRTFKIGVEITAGPSWGEQSAVA